MIQKEKNVNYNSWKLSLIVTVIVSLILIFYNFTWPLICFIGGIISIALIYFDVRFINDPNLETPRKTIIFRYFFRYIVYLVYMAIMFFSFSLYEVIPAAIGLSIPRICLIIYSIKKGGEVI